MTVSTSKPNVKHEIILCGEVIKIHIADDLKGSKKYIAHVSVDTDAIGLEDERRNEVGGITIPLLISDIVIIKTEESLNNMLEGDYDTNIKPIGTVKDIKVGDRYYFICNWLKITRIIDETYRRRLTHIDVKEMFKVSDNYPGQNVVKGTFEVIDTPKVRKSPSRIFSTMRLLGNNATEPRVTGFARGKNASYTEILNRGDEVSVIGSLYSDQYGMIIKDKSGNVVIEDFATDSFSIYINKILV